MYGRFFAKDLKPFSQEDKVLDIIKSAGDKVWWTAKNNDDGSLTFVKDKPDGGFYLSRLKRFPVIVEEILKIYPEAMIENSYVTRCLPYYKMVPHIDPNRHTAIIIPLGNNKGKISFYKNKIKLYTHTYVGPALTRVDILHSAENYSDEMRYGITIEVPGSYYKNYLNY